MMYAALLLIPIVLIVGAVLQAPERSGIAHELATGFSSMRASVSQSLKHAQERFMSGPPGTDALSRRIGAYLLRKSADLLDHQ